MNPGGPQNERVPVASLPAGVQIPARVNLGRTLGLPVERVGSDRVYPSGTRVIDERDQPLMTTAISRDFHGS